MPTMYRFWAGKKLLQMLLFLFSLSMEKGEREKDESDKIRQIGQT